MNEQKRTGHDISHPGCLYSYKDFQRDTESGNEGGNEFDFGSLHPKLGLPTTSGRTMGTVGRELSGLTRAILKYHSDKTSAKPSYNVFKE